MTDLGEDREDWDFTIDVQVLMAAARLGDPANSDESRALLDLILELDSVFLVLDNERLIQQQYSEKLGNSYGTIWARQMASQGRIRYVDRAVVERSIKVELSEEGFKESHEDFRLYVRTVAASRKKHLVTHDGHFGASKVRRILRRKLSVTVISAKGCSELV